MDTDVNVLTNEKNKKWNECRFATIQLYNYDLFVFNEFPSVCERTSIMFSFVYIVSIFSQVGKFRVELTCWAFFFFFLSRRKEIEMKQDAQRTRDSKISKSDTRKLANVQWIQLQLNGQRLTRARAAAAVWESCAAALAEPERVFDDKRLRGGGRIRRKPANGNRGAVLRTMATIRRAAPYRSGHER